MLRAAFCKSLDVTAGLGLGAVIVGVSLKWAHKRIQNRCLENKVKTHIEAIIRAKGIAQIQLETKGGYFLHDVVQYEDTISQSVDHIWNYVRRVGSNCDTQTAVNCVNRLIAVGDLHTVDGFIELFTNQVTKIKKRPPHVPNYLGALGIVQLMATQVSKPSYNAEQTCRILYNVFCMRNCGYFEQHNISAFAVDADSTFGRQDFHDKFWKSVFAVEATMFETGRNRGEIAFCLSELIKHGAAETNKAPRSWFLERIHDAAEAKNVYRARKLIEVCPGPVNILDLVDAKDDQTSIARIEQLEKVFYNYTSSEVLNGAASSLNFPVLKKLVEVAKVNYALRPEKIESMVKSAVSAGRSQEVIEFLKATECRKDE